MKLKKLEKKVIIELYNIKKYATRKELDRLNYSINPETRNKCIYGLMTGNCNSDRSLELLKKCAKPIASNIDEDLNKLAKKEKRPSEFTSVIKGDMLVATDYQTEWFSAVEYYTHRYPVYNPLIIDYLKGYRNTLRLHLDE